ncbi:MAG: site-specific integrase, partial [Saccharofermentans sp.]|nr:site-specific integrase [Saccharofermentans sp.]
ITAEHLQKFMDLVAFGGKEGDFDAGNGYGRSYIDIYNAILKHVFRFAVFPKKYITFNPMQYVVVHTKQVTPELFVSEEAAAENAMTLTPEMFDTLIAYLSSHHPDAVLPVQISYYTGLRVGEVSGLTWKDINLEEQYLVVRRSIAHNTLRRKTEIGTTKRAKVRTVDFGDKLTSILKEAKKQQNLIEKAYGELYQRNYYKEAKEKNRTYYDYYTFNGTENVPEDYIAIDFVCRCRDGRLMTPIALKQVCRYVSTNIPMLAGFHFHALRHTFTNNLLRNGIPLKDVQETLGHEKSETTMRWYAHGNRETKKASAKLLDRLAG